MGEMFRPIIKKMIEGDKPVRDIKDIREDDFYQV